MRKPRLLKNQTKLIDLVDIEARRGSIQSSLQLAIEELATPMLTDQCECRLNLAHSYFQGLQKASLWPLSQAFRQSSLSDITQRMYWMPELSAPRKRYCACSVCDKAYRTLFLNEQKKHLASITGLCLDCVKGGDLNSKGSDTVCRIAHS